MVLALVNAPTTASRPRYEPPLEPASVAGYLRAKSVDVELDDLAVRAASEQRQSKRVKTGVFDDPDRTVAHLQGKVRIRYMDITADRMVGLSPLDLSSADLVGVFAPGIEQLMPALALARTLAEKGTEVVLAGAAAALFAETCTSSFPFLRGVVLAGTEEAFHALATGAGDVPGLVERVGDDVRAAPPHEVPLDKLPPPDFTGLPEDRYRDKLARLPYRISRGCPASCAYCAHHLGHALDVRSPERVAADLAVLVDRFDADEFVFTDNTLNISPGHMEGLCDVLSPLSVRWSGYARPTGLDRQLLSRMRTAGCIKLNLGLESGSQRLLEWFHKGIAVDEAERIIRDAHDAGIACEVNLMVGFPDEREEDLAATDALVRRLAPAIDTAVVNLLTIPRVSEMSQHPERYGIARIHRNTVWADADVAFDEVDGPPWEERAQTRIDAAERLVAVLMDANVDVSDHTMGTLLLLRQAERQRREGYCLYWKERRSCYRCEHLHGDRCAVNAQKSIPP
ncbi:MAG: radical SAM protein [Candidatus Undinarchaeales archaeon]|nr:radical SAM protein [Candidatus Undinarchaeales archaeon]MDP7493259.1 radical SAM protein [Candidatus Undinarchaeales archaeon]